MKTLSVLKLWLALGLCTAVAGCAEPSGSCEAGEEGCPCAASASCEGGLYCVESTGLCEPQRTVALPSISPSARSCEVLYRDVEAVAVEGRFAPSLRGTSLRQAPLTAIAFHAVNDAAIAGGAAQLAIAGEGEVPSVVSAECFGRGGERLPGGGIGTD